MLSGLRHLCWTPPILRIHSAPTLSTSPGKVIISRMPMVAARAKDMLAFVGTPWAGGLAIVADSLDSRLPTLAYQVERGKEKGTDLLVTGLTGFGLSPSTEFGSAPAGADLLPGSKLTATDRTATVTAVRRSALHRRTCAFWRDFNEPGIQWQLAR